MNNSKLTYFQITKNTESILRICRIFHYMNVLEKRPAFKMSIPKTAMDLLLVREFGQNNETKQDDVLIKMGLSINRINNARILLKEFWCYNSKNDHRYSELFRLISLAISLEEMERGRNYSHEFKLPFSDDHLLNVFHNFQKNISTFPTNWNDFLISINHVEYTNTCNVITFGKIVK